MPVKHSLFSLKLALMLYIETGNIINTALRFETLVEEETG